MSSNMNYKTKVECSNCSFKGEQGIPKGTTKQDAKCKVCGCKTLGKPSLSLLGVQSAGQYNFPKGVVLC
jgi:hypothetical protein